MLSPFTLVIKPPFHQMRSTWGVKSERRRKKVVTPWKVCGGMEQCSEKYYQNRIMISPSGSCGISNNDINFSADLSQWWKNVPRCLHHPVGGASTPEEFQLCSWHSSLPAQPDPWCMSLHHKSSYHRFKCMFMNDVFGCFSAKRERFSMLRNHTKSLW